MYNYLLLSALRGGNFEPSKLFSSIYVYIEEANISVFQALVFALFVFSDFFIFCGANAGK